MKSTHLDEIIKTHNRTANLQVVFVDIEKYSQRRTLTQIEVIDAFTALLSDALEAISKTYVKYAQQNNVNFATDVIKLPTGDGAALVFSFDGLHDAHLSLSREILHRVANHNAGSACPKFTEAGWCNCHKNFNVRIGLSEGKGIIFKDMKDDFNVAGSVVNMAARVMSLGDRNQVMFTEEAYKQLIDMVDDPHLVDKFREFKDVQIKHGLKITVYQYIDPSAAYLNSEPTEDLDLKRRAKTAMGQLASAGFPMPPLEEPPSYDKKAVASLIENFAQTMAQSVKRAGPQLPPAAEKK